MDKSTKAFTNRRNLLQGGAALSGAAVIAAGLSPRATLAQEAGESRLQQVSIAASSSSAPGRPTRHGTMKTPMANSSASTSKWPSSSPTVSSG